MSHYQLGYNVTCTNVSPTTMGTAMAAVPIPMDMLNVLDLTVTSDVTTPSYGPPGQVNRTIILEALGAGPLPNAQIAPSLIDYMVGVLELALSTIVTALPIVVTP